MNIDVVMILNWHVTNETLAGYNTKQEYRKVLNTVLQMC